MPLTEGAAFLTCTIRQVVERKTYGTGGPKLELNDCSSTSRERQKRSQAIDLFILIFVATLRGRLLKTNLFMPCGKPALSYRVQAEF
jgi:hypothetical protein